MSAAVYVYYKIAPECAARAKAVIEVMIAEVARQAGVSSRLLRRDSDPQTWLEVYEPLTDFERLLSTLDAATARHEVARFLQQGSVRVLERFVPLD